MHLSSKIAALSWAGQAIAALTGKTLRVMPIGDSITVGACQYNTSNNNAPLGNSYRQYLVNMLDGNQVNFIGSYTDGSARDNQYEAHNGAYLSQMLNLAKNSLGSLPNMYLIHGGVNDLATVNDGQSPVCAPAGSGNDTDVCQQALNNLNNLLNYIYFTNATLIVAQITPSNNATLQNRIVVYNQLIQNLVNQRIKDGWRIQIAPMQPTVTISDIPDQCNPGDASSTGNIVHPNDGGYQKMAKVFYNAIVNASNFGLLQPIRQPYSQPLRQCANVSDSANNWCIQSPVYPSRGQLNFFFGVNCTDSSSSSTQCTCKDSYSDSFAVPKTGSCLEMSTTYTTAVRWADLNGDGRPENVYITPAGALNTSLSLGIYQYNNGFYNQYACQNINSSFKELGVIAPGPQTKRYQVRLADLDADNRAEYIVVNPDGSANGWYNTGAPRTIDNQITVNFGSSSSPVAPSFGVSGVGVRFADFDADGRADYIWVGSNGTLKVWLNQGNTAGTAQVTNWNSQGDLTPPLFGLPARENVQIIDVNSDGRADYVIYNRNDGTTGVWLNLPPASGSNKPQWQFTVFATNSTGSAAGVGGFNELIIADPDGDGDADYLVVNAGDSSVNGLRNRCFNANVGGFLFP